MEFSKRTQWDLEETEWAKLLRQIHETGGKLLDLTASNPTRCGFHYEPFSTLSPLTAAQPLVYDPDAQGDLAARQAVCRYYADHGVTLDPQRVLLASSTSEAYSFLFRLLCDPGDEILIAQPSYPLFHFLAALDDVRLSSYELFYDHGWHIDLDGLRRRINLNGRGRTRAIAVVHPNNPTGHFTRVQERAALEEICLEHDLALIVDEVFLDYGLAAPGQSIAAGNHDVLTFILSGISKVAALPQMKASWIACMGREAQLKAAIGRLQVIADTFLSVSAPVQCALPAWLSGRHTLQRQIQERTGTNLKQLDIMLGSQTLVSRLEVQAGWYVILRIPGLNDDEETVLDLLRLRRIAVHPGSFFGFDHKGWLVVSLLPGEEIFAEGIEGILRHFHGLPGEPN